ncbi:hypothetical protein [Cellulomonas edaphi]|uniref:DUF4240 domain-containing protein n=1 Tax=Cellulomonas edaphi TaxID=3053468 RepID=A0ABT7S5L2_9CELL|nr:hypothetical protein [Cellulomons edaphi]MDM7830269.1 hypothetical protein [Cellulomons edaphi]
MGSARRTAGTRAFWDVVRGWAGYGRTPEDDLADLARGVDLVLAVYALDDRTHRRYLLLGDHDEARASVEALIGPGPHRVFRTDRDAPPPVEPDFRIVEGVDGRGEDWRLAVPRVDLPVLRAALLSMWPRPDRRGLEATDPRP